VFPTLVREISAVEQLMAGVCPLDIGEQAHQPFDCSLAQIAMYESRYNSLSLWEKVSFLCWRYQPTNRSGAIFVSTLQLLSYTALSHEQHRQDLLAVMLQWRNKTSDLPPAEAITSAESAAPSRETFVPVLLAVSTGRTVDHARVQELVQTYLGSALTPEEVEHALDYLAAEGVIVPTPEAGSLMVSTKELDMALHTLGPHAYARELRELIGSAEEARL
jgi:hypothetical protein